MDSAAFTAKAVHSVARAKSRMGRSTETGAGGSQRLGYYT